MLERIKIEADGTPIYVQLKRQLMACVADGVLRPGDQLPTYREMAVHLALSIGTVKAAYHEMAGEDFIVIQQGRGAFVSEFPPTLDGALLEQRTLGLAHQTVAIAISQGLVPLDVGMRIVAIAEETNRAAIGGTPGSGES